MSPTETIRTFSAPWPVATLSRFRWRSSKLSWKRSWQEVATTSSIWAEAPWRSGDEFRNRGLAERSALLAALPETAWRQPYKR